MPMGAKASASSLRSDKDQKLKLGSAINELAPLTPEQEACLDLAAGLEPTNGFPKMTFAMVTPSRVGALNGVSAGRVLQNGGAGLQQGLQVRDDLRPAAGHRLDQFRGFALDGMAYGELDRRSNGFELDRA